MGRRGRFRYRRRYKKRRIRKRDKSSDVSDEEYVLGEDESDNSRDSPDFSSDSSAAADLSEESFEFRETSSDGSDEEQKAVRLKPRKRNTGRKRSGVKRSARRARVLDDYDDDEEFDPDVDDEVDDDDELLTVRKNRIRKVVPKKKQSAKSRKRKKKPKVLGKKASERSGRLALRRSMSSDDDFVVDDKVEREKKKKKKGKKKVSRREKRSIMHSESEFVDSESSDFDFVVSEEERDPLKGLRSQRRHQNLTTCSRSSSMSKRLQVEGSSKVQQAKTVGRKGKEKVNDLSVDTGKQLCGICLSEERKGIVRGTLNCCAHYFCFTCIMEWSKVESRCPVCKQRFTSISKPARLAVGVGLRNSVIRIPKRDQVYQPSEEELSVYLDPYENVICMECQQAGDDDLMLLCDICDSPAHTYCVGLGREVPEGNWYCQGCASSDLGSSNSQIHDPVLDQGTNNSGLCSENTSGGIDAEDFDTIFPEQSSPCNNHKSASPRYPLGEDHRAASPRSGAGAPTISGRRQLRRHIQTLIFNNRMSPIQEMSDRNDGLPHPNLESAVISEVEQGGETAGRARALDSSGSHSAAVEVRKRGPNNPSAIPESSSSMQNRVPFCSRLSISRRQGIPWPTIPSITSSPTDLEQINPSDAVLGHERPNLCSRLVTESNASISQFSYSEGSSFHTAEDAKEQVRSLVKRHLKRLSRDTLERSTFKKIARNSTHTILAVSGIEHSKRIATPVLPPSECSHVETGEPSLLKGCCSSCFDTFVKDVVLRCMNATSVLGRFGA